MKQHVGSYENACLSLNIMKCGIFFSGTIKLREVTYMTHFCILTATRYALARRAKQTVKNIR
jgi:hypothetical protein